MDIEIRIAVEFLLSFVVKKFKGIDTEGFINSLLKSLQDKFKGHWYPDKPNKGSAYRCISLYDHLDNILITAAEESGFDVGKLICGLPTRLDVWIDPKEVSYRIGEHGSVTQIYREGDSELNSKSEYALAVMKNKLKDNAKPKEIVKSGPCLVKQGVRHLGKVKDTDGKTESSKLSQSRKVTNKDQNRLSPTAKSFISKCPPSMQAQGAYTRTTAGQIHQSKAVNSWDYSRKVYWQPGPVYDPIINMQAHNFMLAQEIARYEAHMKAQRIALQTRYHKAPIQYARRAPLQYKPTHLQSEAETGNVPLRIQVVA